MLTRPSLANSSLTTPCYNLAACRNPAKSQNMHRNIWWEYMLLKKGTYLSIGPDKNTRMLRQWWKPGLSRQLEASVIFVYMFDTNNIKVHGALRASDIHSTRHPWVTVGGIIFLRVFLILKHPFKSASVNFSCYLLTVYHKFSEFRIWETKFHLNCIYLHTYTSSFGFFPLICSIFILMYTNNNNKKKKNNEMWPNS